MVVKVRNNRLPSSQRNPSCTLPGSYTQMDRQMLFFENIDVIINLRLILTTETTKILTLSVR